MIFFSALSIQTNISKIGFGLKVRLYNKNQKFIFCLIWKEFFELCYLTFVRIFFAGSHKVIFFYLFSSLNELKNLNIQMGELLHFSELESIIFSLRVKKLSYYWYFFIVNIGFIKTYNNSIANWKFIFL